MGPQAMEATLALLSLAGVASLLQWRGAQSKHPAPAYITEVAYPFRTRKHIPKWTIFDVACASLAVANFREDLFSDVG